MANKNNPYTSELFGNDEAYKADVERAKKIQKETGKKPKKAKEVKFEKPKLDNSVNKETERLEKKGRKEAEENRKLIAQGKTRDIFESIRRIIRETVNDYIDDMSWRYAKEDDFRNNFDWGKAQDEEDEYYQDMLQDPDAYKDDIYTDLADGDLYR